MLRSRKRAVGAAFRCRSKTPYGRGAVEFRVFVALLTVRSVAEPHIRLPLASLDRREWLECSWVLVGHEHCGRSPIKKSRRVVWCPLVMRLRCARRASRRVFRLAGSDPFVFFSARLVVCGVGRGGGRPPLPPCVPCHIFLPSPPETTTSTLSAEGRGCFIHRRQERGVWRPLSLEFD